MRSIALLAPQLPVPADRGARIRTFHLLRALSRRCDQMLDRQALVSACARVPAVDAPGLAPR